MYFIPPKAYRTLDIFSLIWGVILSPVYIIFLPSVFKSIFFYLIIWPFSSQNSIFTIFFFWFIYYLKFALIYADTETNFENAWLKGEMSKYSGGRRFSYYFLSFFPFFTGAFLVCFLGLLNWAAIFS